MCIAGDWGTSNLRLYLCRHHPAQASEILEIQSGPGVAEIAGGRAADGFEEVFFALAGGWIEKYGNIPVILSGMIGSNIGWKEAPYLPCPTNPAAMVQGRMSFSVRGLEINILAGLKTVNPFGLPDVMRGEELQLLGLMQELPDKQLPRLVALPGTHNKWALLQNGRVETFLTVPTGELYSVLGKHSVLISTDADGHDQSVFLQGVEAAESKADADFIHVLFSTRSRQVLGELPADKAPAYLSGLLLGSDVMGALTGFSESDPQTGGVTLIGESKLAECYRLVLERQGVAAKILDPHKIAIAGYRRIFQSLLEAESGT